MSSKSYDRPIGVYIEQMPNEREVRIVLTAHTVDHADEIFEVVCSGVRARRIELDLGVVLSVNDGLGVLQ